MVLLRPHVQTKKRIFAPYLKKTKIMRVKLVSVVALFVLLLGACSVPKDVVYFQGVDALTPEKLEQMSQTYKTIIRPGDLLNITVTAWDPSVVPPFNPPVYAYAQQGDLPVAASASMYNYLVDKEGFINFPVIGKVKVENFTCLGLAEELQQKISKYVTDPLVNVQITNFKVSVMGEVARPGALTVRNDRMSVLDAIGLVGDLTINANRKNILLIREDNGVKTFARLDLTNPELFTSPYYYMQQNDILYVEPNKAKQRNSRYSQAQQYSITVFSSILSAISVITTVILAITK